MEIILWSLAVLGGLGILFGIGLGVASKKLAVEVDQRVIDIRENLPGANCGGCGFAGCDALADAIAAGQAPVNACPVGGAATAAEIAKIMGVEEAPQQVRNVATVVCQGTLDRCKTKFQYHGIKDCVAATLVNAPANMHASAWVPACGPASLMPSTLTRTPESPRWILKSARAAEPA